MTTTLAERVERVLTWIDGGCSSWGTPSGDIKALAEAAAHLDHTAAQGVTECPRGVCKRRDGITCPNGECDIVSGIYEAAQRPAEQPDFNPHPDQTSPMTVGPEEYLDSPNKRRDEIVTALELAVEWLEIDQAAEDRGVVDRIRDALKLAEQPDDLRADKEQWRKLCHQHEQTILDERTRAEAAEAEADRLRVVANYNREQAEAAEARVRALEEVLAAALDEHDINNGPLTDTSDPHWSNGARALLDKPGDGYGG